MMNPPPPREEFGHVADGAEWSLCEELIKSFEEAWRLGNAPAIQDHLAVEPELRSALLIELVHVDLELRLKRGDAVRVERYLESFPELAQDRPVVVELLAAELALRNRYQGPVETAEYVRRFPDLRETLVKRLSSVGETTLLAPTSSPRPQAAAPPEVPGYEIVEQIGRGGMGIVYKARDPHLDRYVALKFLPPEYAASSDRLDRFLREARTASALNHPHICTVHALDKHNERPFIVMEFVEGRTLQAFASSRQEVADVVGWIVQAARALAAAHAAGVVHRDIKPENIMVRDDGYVKVLDFGLARQLPALLASQSDASPKTDAGMLLGTLAYMSPEQTNGSPAESASDVFSLGIVAYQLLTGQHPFDGETPLATLNAIATHIVPPASHLNPEVPVALSGLVEAMLHKEPHLRPTAEEVERALDALQSVAAVRPPEIARRALVRREAELVALRDALARADAGHGSFVCVSGEPGIGKTTLVETFLAELNEASGYLVARGNCSERLADTEAYLPVMDALENLLRTDENGSAARLMRIVAPTWYSQIAPGTGDAATDATERSRAMSQQAMLREFCNFLQECSRLGTIVLFFDDLHWADVSTVDLLAHLGRNCPDLRTLVVATYRPTEMLLGPHPFHGVKLELQARGVCCDLGLKFLDRREVADYLDLAFPDHAFGDDFADLIHSRTEGSPLFMADLLRYLRERGFLAQIDGTWSVARELPDLSRELPESVRGMIQRKLDRLDRSDRQLLAAASVQGCEFDSQIVADALQRDSTDIEERLDELARVHGLLRTVRASELPDGALSMRCSFVHILYQQALYHNLLPTRRASLSLALARALERRFGVANPAAAAELACLYEEGRDLLQSARQYWLASQNAARVFAHGDAVALARRGIKLLQSLPASPQKSELELQLQTALGLQLQVTEGFGATSAQEAYSRARQLCLRSPEGPPLFPILWGLWLYYKVRSELTTAQHFAADLARLARKLNDPDLSLQAHQALAMTAFCRGQHEPAQQHVEQAVALYDRRRHVSHSFQFGQDPSVICKAFGADVLWLLGYPDAAARQSEDAIRMSENLSPSSQAVALYFAATVYQLRREPRKALSCAEKCLAVASEHGYSFWTTAGGILRGWAVAELGDTEEGIAAMRSGIRDWHNIGSKTYRTYFLGILAETLSRHAAPEEARQLLDEAISLATRTGEAYYEPELRRLKGELLLTQFAAEAGPPPDAARDELQRALEMARKQSAKSLELRAAMSLARHCPQFGNAVQAREQLAQSYHWFTDGFQTPDLKNAVQLLASPLWNSV